MRICNECPNKAIFKDFLTNTLYCSKDCFLIGNVISEDTTITVVILDGNVIKKKYQIPYYNAVVYSGFLRNVYVGVFGKDRLHLPLRLPSEITEFAMDLLIRRFTNTPDAQYLRNEIENLPQELKTQVFTAIEILQLHVFMDMIGQPSGFEIIDRNNLLSIAYLLDFPSLIALQSTNKFLQQFISSNTMFKNIYIQRHMNDPGFIQNIADLIIYDKKRLVGAWLMDDVLTFENPTPTTYWENNGKYQFIYEVSKAISEFVQKNPDDSKAKRLQDFNLNTTLTQYEEAHRWGRIFLSLLPASVAEDMDEENGYDISYLAEGDVYDVDDEAEQRYFLHIIESNLNTILIKHYWSTLKYLV